jgi:hypothetical protein
VSNGSFTPTQARIMAVLEDTMLHSRAQLLEAIGDSQATDDLLRAHIANIRKVLRRRGQDILCVREQGYRWVRLMQVE